MNIGQFNSYNLDTTHWVSTIFYHSGKDASPNYTYSEQVQASLSSNNEIRSEEAILPSYSYKISPVGPMDSPWPMYTHDLIHSGRSPYSTNNVDGLEKWRFKVSDGVDGGICIDTNGILYFGSYDKYIYSLNPDGTLRWKFQTGGGICMPPTIDKDGTVYIGSWDNYLYAIDGSTGEEIEEEYVDNQDEKDNNTPGFEMIILLISIIIFMYIKRRIR